MTIRIDLDGVKQDGAIVSRARCTIPGSRSHVESIGYGENLRKVCQALVKMGVTGRAAVMRGDMHVFAGSIDIEHMAETGGVKFG